eukprot:gene358-13005_t
MLLAAAAACRQLVCGDRCANCGKADPALMCEPCSKCFYCDKACLTTHRKRKPGSHKEECARFQLEEKDRLACMVWGGTALAVFSFALRIVHALLYSGGGGGGHDLTAQLLLCGLGINYAMAFLSMRRQVLGLVGTAGIMPCSDEGVLDEIRTACKKAASAAAAAADVPVHLAPCGEEKQTPATSQTWQDDLACKLKAATFNLRYLIDRLVLRAVEPALSSRDPKATDLFLRRLCGAGVAGGALLAATQLRCFGTGAAATALQLAQLPLMLGLWWAYYIIRRLTKAFTNLQWDMLLLEYGAVTLPLAVPFIPSQVRVLLLFPATALLIKLMFSSGVVKRRSKCPKWNGLTAMCYHYETQPLPHGLAWYAFAYAQVRCDAAFE